MFLLLYCRIEEIWLQKYNNLAYKHRFWKKYFSISMDFFNLAYHLTWLPNKMNIPKALRCYAK